MSKPLVFSFRNADRFRWYVKCERLDWHEDEDRWRWNFSARVERCEQPVAVGYYMLMDGEEPDKLLAAQVISQSMLGDMFGFGRYAHLIDENGYALSVDPPAEPAPADNDIPEWIDEVRSGWYGAQDMDGEVWEYAYEPCREAYGWKSSGTCELIGKYPLRHDYATTYWHRIKGGKPRKITVSAATGEAPKRAE